jgi:predicted GTPase
MTVVAKAISTPVVQMQVLLLETEPPPPLRGLRTQQDTPVLVLLGHFNHGKTTLLDALLGPESCIVQGEAAGITQEIRARTVSLCTSADSSSSSSGECAAVLTAQLCL